MARALADALSPLQRQLSAAEVDAFFAEQQPPSLAFLARHLAT